VTLSWSSSSSSERSELLVERSELEKDGWMGRPRPRPLLARRSGSTPCARRLGRGCKLTFPPELLLVLLDSSAASPSPEASAEELLRSEPENSMAAAAAATLACSSSVPVLRTRRPRPRPTGAAELEGFMTRLLF
jgi:hypothetical protein